jgi:hypothetical protein
MESEVKNLFWRIQPNVFLVSDQNNIISVLKAMGDEEIYYMQSTQSIPIKYFVLRLNKNELSKKEIEDSSDELATKIMQTLNLKKLNMLEYENEYGVFEPAFLFSKPSPKGRNLVNYFYKAGDLVYTLKQKVLLYSSADMDYNTYLLKFNTAKNTFTESNITVDYEKEEKLIKRGVRVWNYRILVFKVLDVQIVSSFVKQVIVQDELEKQIQELEKQIEAKKAELKALEDQLQNLKLKLQLESVKKQLI